MYGSARKSNNLANKASYQNGYIAVADGTTLSDNSGWIRNVEYIAITNAKVTIKAKALSGSSHRAYFYNASKEFISTERVENSNEVTFTMPTNAKYIRHAYSTGTTSSISNFDAYEIQINEGTTALPYEPYGLIMSKGEVESQSANLVQMESGGINQTTGEPSTSSTTIRSANFVDYTSTSTFVISGVTPTQTTSAIRIFEYSTNGAYVQSRLVYIGTDNTAKLTFSGDGKFKLHISTEIASVNTLMLNSGNVAKSYVPYGHSEISAYDVVQNYLLSVSDVKDELCVNADGTGVRTPRFKVVDMSTLNWAYNSTYNVFNVNLTDGKLPTDENPIGLGLCSCYDYINVSVAIGNFPDKTIVAGYRNMSSKSCCAICKDSSYSDVEAFKTAMSGQYLIYELATVTPQTLTASQVQSLLALETYKSHTDIVADCTVDVTYYKDNANGQSVADIDARYRKLFDSIIDSLS